MTSSAKIAWLLRMVAPSKDGRVWVTRVDMTWRRIASAILEALVLIFLLVALMAVGIVYA